MNLNFNPTFLIVSFSEQELNLLYIKKYKKFSKLLACANLDFKLDLKTNANIAEFAQIISSWLVRQKIKCRNIAIILPSYMVFTYKLEFDISLPQKTIVAQSIDKISQILNLDSAEFNFDFAQTFVEQTSYLTTFSVKTSFINNLQQALKTQKLRLKLLDTEYFCRTRLVSAIEVLPKTNLIWLDIDSQANCFIFTNNQLQSKKLIPLATQDLQNIVKNSNPNLFKLDESQTQIYADFVQNLSLWLKQECKFEKNQLILISGFLANFKNIIADLKQELEQENIIKFAVTQIPQVKNTILAVNSNYLLQTMPLNLGLAVRNLFT